MAKEKNIRAFIPKLLGPNQVCVMASWGKFSPRIRKGWVVRWPWQDSNIIETVQKSVIVGFYGIAGRFTNVYLSWLLKAFPTRQVLKIWQEENLTDRAAQVGEYFMRQLAGLKEHAIVGDVRGLGLMVAIEFVRDRATKEPFPVEKQVAKLVGKLALQNGLVTYPGTGMVDGQRGDVISLFPPLIFTPQHVDELASKLDQTLTQVEQVI